MENVAINRSASDKDKQQFIAKNLANQQFANIRTLVDSGVVVIDVIPTKGLDALLKSVNALCLDELANDQAILQSFSYDTTVVARVNSTLADTISHHGLQATKGLSKVHVTATFYVNLEKDLAAFKQGIMEGLYDNVSHVAGGYGIAFEAYNKAKEEAKS